VRENKNLRVKVRTEAMPEKLMNASNQGGNLPEWSAPAGAFGATIKPLTRDLAREYEIKGVTEGVVVTQVEENSDAAKLGLLPGDVITEVNGTPVNSAKEFRKALKAGKEKGARIKLLRDGAKTFLFYKDHSE
jgi:serine protease Do